MIDAAKETQTTSRGTAPSEDKSFGDVLRALVGKPVTVVNPESYEDAPVGHQIRVGFYKAKVAGLGRDYLILHTSFASIGRTGKTLKEEPVKQFIPIERIKRLSLMEKECVLHL